MSNKTVIAYVEAHKIPSMWEVLHSYLEPQYRDSLAEDVSDVYHALLCGDYSLWFGYTSDKNEPDFCVITYLQNYPRGYFLFVAATFVFAGKKYDPQAVLKFFSDVGKALDCIGYEIIGRAGWERVYPQAHKQGVVLRATFDE